MSTELFQGELEGTSMDVFGTVDLEQYLVFSCAGGTYGINILETHEILRPVPITRLPNVEPEYLGVLNLRGNIIPLLDCARKFGEDYADLTQLSRIVVCASRGKFIGLVVDRILEVARIPSDRVEGKEVAGLSGRYMKGVGRSDQRLFLILSLDTLTAGEQDG